MLPDDRRGTCDSIISSGSSLPGIAQPSAKISGLMATRLYDVIAPIVKLPASDLDDDSGNATIAAWDSLAEVELACALEFEYGVKIGPDDLDALTSVAAIRALLAKHAQYPP